MATTLNHRLYQTGNGHTNHDHETFQVFSILVNGQDSEREKIRASLNDAYINRSQLRSLIVDMLERQSTTEFTDADDPDAMLTRSWLLCVLGRICDDDVSTLALLQMHLQPDYEKEAWVRYWTLEGLIAGNVQGLNALASQVCQQDQHVLVTQLANAVLAKSGDRELLKKILVDLKSDNADVKWATLRALRIVPLLPTIPALCELVETTDYNDNTYEAIFALGQIPSQCHHTAMAVQALSRFVRKKRRSPKRDTMRAKALNALGNLMDESVIPILINHLNEDNPNIVREAAWALEKIGGGRTAVTRILEVAANADRKQLENFASALRWMDRESIVNELEAAMISGPVVYQDTARLFLSEIGGVIAYQKLRARTDTIDQYISVMEKAEAKVQDFFDVTISKAHSGFKWVIVMDITVFIVGIILITISAVLALYQEGSLGNWLGVSMTGGIGVLGVLYSTLIGRPRQQIKEAVDHLMHLQIIFLAYIRQLHQTDQVFTRRLIEERSLTHDDLKLFSSIVTTTMANAVQELSKCCHHHS